MTAEIERAIELGCDQADTAAGVLRLFSPANYRADETSPCAPLGQVHEPERQVFFVEGGRIANSSHAREGGTSQWGISTGDLADFRVMGLAALDHVLKKPERTAFENDVLSAILLYTRGALERDLSDRLVYQFAGLESLLLGDGQESIVHNLSERIAFGLETTADARFEVITAVKDAYGLRSGFVHHGRPVHDLVAFDRFAAHAWRFLLRVTRNLHFPSKHEFIKAIERIKLS